MMKLFEEAHLGVNTDDSGPHINVFLSRRFFHLKFIRVNGTNCMPRIASCWPWGRILASVSDLFRIFPIKSLSWDNAIWSIWRRRPSSACWGHRSISLRYQSYLINIAIYVKAASIIVGKYMDALSFNQPLQLHAHEIFNWIVTWKFVIASKINSLLSNTSKQVCFYEMISC